MKRIGPIPQLHRLEYSDQGQDDKYENSDKPPARAGLHMVSLSRSAPRRRAKKFPKSAP